MTHVFFRGNRDIIPWLNKVFDRDHKFFNKRRET